MGEHEDEAGDEGNHDGDNDANGCPVGVRVSSHLHVPPQRFKRAKCARPSRLIPLVTFIVHLEHTAVLKGLGRSAFGTYPGMFAISWQ